MKQIRICKATITPDSARDGDFADLWEDDPIAMDDIESTIDYLSANVCYASASKFHAGIWYATQWDVIDYRTLTEEETTYHLSGYTVEEQRAIYDRLKSERHIV